MNTVVKKMTINDKAQIIQLLIKKFNESCAGFTSLPDKFTKSENLEGYVDWMLNQQLGFVAYKKNQMVGFIFGIFLEKLFYSHSGVYTPEWGFYLDDNHHRENLLLLSEIYKEMLLTGHLQHSISVMNNQEKLQSFLFDNAYASRCIDANWLITEKKDVDLGSFAMVQASGFYKDKMVELVKEHHEYMLAVPTLVGFSYDDEQEVVSNWLREENDVVWLLIDQTNNEVAGMIKTSIGTAGGCDVSYDEETLGIETTHLFDKYRGQGLAENMIKFIYNHAKAQGFKRLAVDYETQNPSANYFWKKYFTPTVRSLVRYIG
jgi:GNAT superfamily N-acetyltransferase